MMRCFLADKAGCVAVESASVKTVLLAASNVTLRGSNGSSSGAEESGVIVVVRLSLRLSPVRTIVTVRLTQRTRFVLSLLSVL